MINNHIAEHYLQAFPYDVLEPCFIFSVDPTWLDVGKPLSPRNMFILQFVGMGVETSSVHKKSKQHQWQVIGR